MKNYPCHRLNCTPKVGHKTLGVQFNFCNEGDFNKREVFPFILSSAGLTLVDNVLHSLDAGLL